MGKSNKKLKSERINTLRKQYDAFLEEDKKRKERNEYILGRLDKMRYSTSLVPVRDKIPHQRPHNNLPTRDQQKPINRQQMFQNNLYAMEDNCIIQEISKNYILIPKLRSTLTNPYIQQIVPINEQTQVDVQNLQNSDTGITRPSAIDNNWQSKYEILNILKKEEKENQTCLNPSSKCTALLNNGIPINEKTNTNCDYIAENNNGNLENKYMHELPEKDLSDKKIIDTHNSTDNDYGDVQTYSIDEKTDSKEFSVLPTDNVDVIEYKLQNTNLADGNLKVTDKVDVIDYYLQSSNLDDNSKVSALTSEITNYAEHDAEINDLNHVRSGEQTYYEEQLETDYNKEESDGKNLNDWTSEPQPSADQFLTLEPTNKIYVDEQKENAVQIIGPSDVMEEIDPLNAVDSNTTIPNVDDASHSEHNDELVCMPGIDEEEPPIEKIYEVKNTAVEQEHVDDTDLQAFDAEQREMFYMEQPAETYNINEDVNENEQEYSQNVVEDQNQEYSYYESTQPEAYPVNLDVNEEQTLRYDPIYQQQYVESYEKSYEQQPQQYEVEQNDQMNSEQLEQINAQESKETPEGIELTLDTEEGYKQQQDDENLVDSPETENRQN